MGPKKELVQKAEGANPAASAQTRLSSRARETEMLGAEQLRHMDL